MDREAVVAAADRIARTVLSDPRYARTSALRVDVDGATLVEHRYPAAGVSDAPADVFSVTKSVLATLVGIAVGDGVVRDLDERVGAYLDLAGTPAATHTWRHLLTMTRGAAVDGPYDVDALTALPGGLVATAARAPQVASPGKRFTYDDAGTHLLAAALGAACGTDVASYAARRLFPPLGVGSWAWARDGDGIPYGYAHLRLDVDALARLGRLWLEGGSAGGTQVLPAAFVRKMTTPSSPGGAPEHRPYGYLVWVERDGSFFAGGWAGQHVLVLPAARAVVVTTGEPRFDPGPPPRDALPPDWRPALELVRAELLPELRA